MPQTACARRIASSRRRPARESWTRARAISDMRRRSHRPERVAEVVRQTVAEFLTGTARDPRIGFVTVTGVEVSGDLQHARVRVSVMAVEGEKARSLDGLARCAGYLRNRLAETLPLRIAPELTFELGRGIEHAQQIDRVLKELKEDT